MAVILDNEVGTYLENLETDGVVKKQKINAKYRQYLAICKFTTYSYPISNIDGYTFMHDFKTSSYTLNKGKLHVNFRLMSDILSEKKKMLSRKSEEIILTDQEYDKLEFYIDQIDYLKRLSHRNECHKLVKQYAKAYNMNAVTGLLVPKYDDMELYHSWLENDEYCFDITNDLVLDKKTYHKYVKEKINTFTPQELENYGDDINGYYTLLYMAAKKKIKSK